jgi:hypothetical protein
MDKYKFLNWCHFVFGEYEIHFSLQRAYDNRYPNWWNYSIFYNQEKIAFMHGLHIPGGITEDIARNLIEETERKLKYNVQ